MSDRTGASARPNRMPFIAAVAIIVALGAVIYFGMASQPSVKRVKLALVTWNQDPFWDPVVQGALDAGKEFDADVEIVKAKPELEDQNQRIRELIGKGVEGIGVSLNDPTAQEGLLKEVAAKCAVVTMDVDAPNSARRVFVGIDNYSAGHFAADEMREALPEGGAIIITVGSIDMLHGRERRQGVIDGLIDRHYLMEHSFDPLDATLKGSNYSVATTIIDHGDTAKSTQLLAEALKTHPEVKGVVALFSYSAGAALDAIKQAGKQGQIKVVGFDESEATQAGIEDGSISASILQDTYRMGNETIRLLADEVRSSDKKSQAVPAGPRKVIVEINILKKDNLQQLRDSKSVHTPVGKPTTQPLS